MPQLQHMKIVEDVIKLDLGPPPTAIKLSECPEYTESKDRNDFDYPPFLYFWFVYVAFKCSKTMNILYGGGVHSVINDIHSFQCCITIEWG